MAVLSTNNLTLLDHAKRLDPEGRIATIAELLSTSNEILQDCVWRESNLPTGHREVIRTGLPDVYWRSLNQGIPSSKSTTAQVDEACAILEARSEVDKDLAMLNGNTAAFRLSEDAAFLEAMNQRMATTLFYGNPATDPKEFLGLANRYNSTSAGNGQNVLKAGGASTVGSYDNTSIYLVCWGDQTIFCPFPKGSKAGLIHEDLGEQTVYTASAGTSYASAAERMQALVTRYQWKCGLMVKDWRYAVRIANIDVGELTDFAAGSTNSQDLQSFDTNIIHLMARAVYRLPSQTMGRCAFYMNRTVHSALSRMAMEKSLNILNIEQGLTQFGTAQSYLTFLGIPIRRCDAIVNNEATIS
jgi:hypothetical protein